MRGILQDLGYGLRMLRKNPGFTAIAVVTMGLGIGANTAIFSVVHAALLRPLPFREPNRLAVVRTLDLRRNNQISYTSYPDFLDWRAQNHSFEELAAFDTDQASLTGRGDPVQLRIVAGSANLFSILGVSPAFGRSFTGDDDISGAAFPLIISHRLWQERFSSDPKILGQMLTLDGRGYTVVGVMPPGFQFPVRTDSVDVWTSMASEVTPHDKKDVPLAAQRGARYLSAIGRLKPGVSFSTAQTDVGAIQGRLNQEHPENRPRGISVVPEMEQVTGDMRPALLILFGAVGFVLLIACANVANLLTARVVGRRREISIRSALGASRWVIVRMLLVESTLLSLLGAVLGVGLAAWSIQAFTKLTPSSWPRVADSGLSSQVLGFTLTVAVLTGIAFGLWPALESTKRELNQSLNEGGRGGEGATRTRSRNVLIIAEVGLAMILLIGAGLMLQSLLQLRRASPGFSTDHVLTFGLQPPTINYPDQKRAEFYTEFLAHARTVPGIRAVSAVFPLPLTESAANTGVEIEGRPVAGGDRATSDVSVVYADYFRAMGIPLIKGRVFTEQDKLDAPAVAVVNETFARRYFPGENPLGKRIRPGVWYSEGDGPMFQIVGVVGDVKHVNMSTPPNPEVYEPYLQDPFAGLSIVVRTVLPPEEMVASMRDQVQAMDKNLPMLDVRMLDEYVESSMAAPRFDTLVLASFAVLALALTAIGLYGVVSYSVSQRTREIGIRIALGAEHGDILRLVLRQGLALCVIGVGLGLAGSLGLARVIASLLYGIRATDTTTFAGIALLLLIVTVLASYIPARQASAVDPLVALRYE
jgi:putative ABC transport system permease protein